MLVFPDGSTEGTIGGGKIEAQATEEALEALRCGESRLATYVLLEEGEHALGMVCGGEASVFLEARLPVRTLLIIGAGHVAASLAPLARLLDYRVVVMDERSQLATRERFPEADEVVLGNAGEAGSLVRIDRYTAVVIVTHGHLHDQAALASVLETDAGYIGMIGSRRKVRTILAELEKAGVPATAFCRVHAPIGLDLGGQTPAEISLSILAQIVATQHGRSTGGLSVALEPAALG